MAIVISGYLHYLGRVSCSFSVKLLYVMCLDDRQIWYQKEVPVIIYEYNYVLRFEKVDILI